jgi:hypothetical protein
MKISHPHPPNPFVKQRSVFDPDFFARCAPDFRDRAKEVCLPARGLTIGSFQE